MKELKGGRRDLREKMKAAVRTGWTLGPTLRVWRPQRINHSGVAQSYEQLAEESSGSGFRKVCVQISILTRIVDLG